MKNSRVEKRVTLIGAAKMGVGKEGKGVLGLEIDVLQNIQSISREILPVPLSGINNGCRDGCFLQCATITKKAMSFLAYWTGSHDVFLLLGRRLYQLSITNSAVSGN